MSAPVRVAIAGHGLAGAVFHAPLIAATDELELRRIVESGELGAITRFESHFDRFRPEVRAGAWREAAAPDERGGYERFCAGVRDALRDATDMPVDPRDAVAALRVVEAARRSARNATVIDTTEEEGS